MPLDDYLRMASMVSAIQAAITAQVALFRFPNQMRGARLRSDLDKYVRDGINTVKAMQSGRNNPDLRRKMENVEALMLHNVAEAIKGPWGNQP